MAEALNTAYVSTERLYLDKDGNVVKEGDDSAVELLVGVNGTLPRDKAVAYGLISDTQAPTTEAGTVVTVPEADQADTKGKS